MLEALSSKAFLCITSTQKSLCLSTIRNTIAKNEAPFTHFVPGCELIQTHTHTQTHTRMSLPEINVAINAKVFSKYKILLVIYICVIPIPPCSPFVVKHRTSLWWKHLHRRSCCHQRKVLNHFYHPHKKWKVFTHTHMHTKEL